MSPYFYVVNQRTGKVLDSQRNYKNAQLITRRGNGNKSQLWKWDSEARLVNKDRSNYVVDVLNESIGSGTPVVLNNPEDDNLGQNWSVEDNTIKSGLSGLVMDVSDSWITMKESSGRMSQKWEFVPEDCWEDYKMMLDDKNPLTEAAFWKDVLENYIHVIIGCSIDEYESKVKEAIELMNMYADKLEKVNKSAGVAKSSGGAASVVGGGMAIGGWLLAPFAAASSLALTVGGTVVGMVGGAATLTSSVVNSGYGQGTSKRVNNATSLAFNATFRFQGFLHHYLEKLKQAKEFLKTAKGEAIEREVYSNFEKIKHGGTAVWKTIQTFNTPTQIKEVITCTKSTSFEKAAIATARGFSIPILGSLLGLKPVVAAGSISGKALSASLTRIGIAFGLWEFAEGQKMLKAGSALAEELRQAATELETLFENLIQVLCDLQKIAPSEFS